MHRMTARFLVVAAAAALASGACGKKEEAAAPAGSPPAKKYRFAVMPKALNLPVFTYARTGAERAAKELGNVEVLWRAPESADPLKQKEILESFITQGVDGIAISCTSADLLNDPINKAMDAGIPVVTWDTDAPSASPSGAWTTSSPARSWARRRLSSSAARARWRS
jgi:ABC-type sugar transport system substrate-binding protein